VLSIDPPWKRNLGWAISQLYKTKVVVKDHGLWDIPTFDNKYLLLHSIHEWAFHFVKKHKIDLLVLERSQGNGCIPVRIGVAESTASIITGALSANPKIQIVEISPMHMKLVVAGNARADKDDVIQAAVKCGGQICADIDIEHVADAVGLVYCYFDDLKTGWKPKEKKKKKRKKKTNNG